MHNAEHKLAELEQEIIRLRAANNDCMEWYNAARQERDMLLHALENILCYFRSGNACPVPQALIKANSKEIIAAIRAVETARDETFAMTRTHDTLPAVIDLRHIV